MNQFCSKAAICTDPNQRTRFIPETEPLEQYLTGFAGLTGDFIVKKHKINAMNMLMKY